MSSEHEISLYDYSLPAELIASEPPPERESARLLVIDRQSGSIAHHHVSDLPGLLRGGDLLVRNNTRVIPARLTGSRTATGGRWEGLFLREESDGRWRILGQTRGRLLPGETLTLTPAEGDDGQTRLVLNLDEKQEGGEWLARPQSQESAIALLDRFGAMPLPPYMHRAPRHSDRERYQTTYAERPGAVAAPTAGLHFTPHLLEQCRSAGITAADVTLHVGIGTFRPISVERLDQHEMHSEWCELPEATVEAIRSTRDSGGRVVAVGTTSVRTLESVAATGELRPWQGETNLFIRPPYEFQVVDVMLTNFHLPKSTLLVLVSAFAGRELILQAYQKAIEKRYRFYSYGDAMLIL